MVMAHTDRSAHRSASYVTTPCLGIPSQHSDERECHCDYNNDLAHMNLPNLVARTWCCRIRRGLGGRAHFFACRWS
jgi:hypothetical protein